MDVSRWPLHRIMALPDWCFGRRWWVGTYIGLSDGKWNIVIAEENLPDKFVVWGLLFCGRSVEMTEAFRFSVRLVDQVTPGVAFTSNEDLLFKGISDGRMQYEFYFQPNSTVWIPAERQIIESRGRKIAIMGNGDQTNTAETTLGVLISGIPKEVPDWVVSGLAGVR